MASPSLLGLPPELRNRIYELVLVEAKDIAITQSNYAQPALLRVCREIREEASGIYYKSNTFCVDVTDLDMRASNSFEQHSRSFNPTIWTYGWISEDSWANVLKACEAAHGGRALSVLMREKKGMAWRQTARALDLVQKLKNVPWAQVQDVLQTFKNVVADSDRNYWRWA